MTAVVFSEGIYMQGDLEENPVRFSPKAQGDKSVSICLNVTGLAFF